jgi:hypothetical protein
MVWEVELQGGNRRCRRAGVAWKKGQYVPQTEQVSLLYDYGLKLKFQKYFDTYRNH